MRRLLKVLLVVVVGLLGYGVGLAQPHVLRPPLVPGQDAAGDPAGARAVVSLDDVGGRVLSVRPEADADIAYCAG